AWLETISVEATSRLEYRNRVVELISDAAKADPAIAAQLTNALQALADTDPADALYAEQIATTLTTRDGPDWKSVLANRDHIVLNLWDTLRRALLAEPSVLDTSNRDAAFVRGQGSGVRDQFVDQGTDPRSPIPDPLSDLRR